MGMGFNDNSTKSQFVLYGYKDTLAIRLIAYNEDQKLLISKGIFDRQNKTVGEKGLVKKEFMPSQLVEASQFFESLIAGVSA